MRLAQAKPIRLDTERYRVTFITNRGYTGHEHLDAFGIINMNGRVYDPLTAMFFSPDPFVQAPGNWLNYNRYGYCMNNPTRFTDPSGYVAKTLEQALVYLWFSTDGGTWTSSGGGSGDAQKFSNQDEGVSWGSAYNDRFGSWEYTAHGSRDETVRNYNLQRDFLSGRVALVGFNVGDNQKYFAYLDTKTGKFYDFNSSLESDPYSEYNIYNKNSESRTVDNSLQATMHYLFGDGSAVKIGPNTTQSILSSPEFQKINKEIISHKRIGSGTFPVNMRDRVFHIGRTSASYSTSINTVTYKLFVNDGFWDPDFIDEGYAHYFSTSSVFIPDGKGPSLERFGGTPYDYIPITMIYNIP